MNNNDPNLLNNTTNANLIDDLLANPFDEVQELEKLSPQEAKPVKLIDVIPEENRAKAYQLAEQIDPTNHQAMISYGTPAQSKLLTFSNSMLEHVQKKDVGEVGDIISDLMKKLNDLSPDELKPDKPSFFARMFGKLTGSVQEVLSKYQKTGAQIDRISVKLDRSKNILLSDIVILEKLYETNKEYFQALNVYIALGKLNLKKFMRKQFQS